MSTRPKKPPKNAAWQKLIAASLRWARKTESDYDRKSLGRLVGHKNLERWGEADREAFVGELLDSIREKFGEQKTPGLQSALATATITIQNWRPPYLG